jgi:4a-hydroxytetrahydrobiopterin dehydratase
MSAAEIKTRMADFPDWEVENDALTRTFTLPDFAHAVLFIGAIGQLAEAANHHPDLHLFSYKKLTVEISTHSAGGITEKDFSLARGIQELPQRKTQS